jgi:uncharacterized protein YvpB
VQQQTFRSPPATLTILRFVAAIVCIAAAPIVSVIAQRELAAAASLGGGAVLDGFGGVWPFGGLVIDTNHAPRWNGWDIARSVALMPDGSGGWTLDGYGGIHSWGAAPNVDATSYSADLRARAAHYWAGWDIARALVVLPDETSGYVLDGYGGIWPFGHAPAFTNTVYWAGSDIARGLDIHLDSNGTPDGGAVLDGTGAVHPFGNYPYALTAQNVFPEHNVFQALGHVAGHVYAVGRFGKVLEETTGAPMTPAWSGYPDWGNWDIARAAVLVSPSGGSGAQPLSLMAQTAWQSATGPRGGALLDGWGGVHPFGGLNLDITHAPYWTGWDIARSLVLLPDGSGGWTLDGYGGIHSWGGAGNVNAGQYSNDPRARAGPYWNGWDIARALVVNPDGKSGYVLDGYGGVWPFGGAPSLTGYQYWSGSDVARGLLIHYTNAGVPDGGWTLDGYGGLWPFGAASDPVQPQYWSGRDLYQRVHQTYDGHMYTVSRWGAFADLSAVMKPYWNGYSDWRSWDIIRDLVLVGSDDAHQPSQPMSSEAAASWWRHVWVYAFHVPPIQQELPLDCESAALEEATMAKGADVNQITIFNELPKEPGSAQWSGNDISRWGDPYAAFVGDVYGSESRATGYGVYDGPIATIATNHGFHAIGLESGGPNEIYTYLAKGDPVVIFTSYTYRPVATHYWTAWDGRTVPYSLTDHAVTIIAVNGVAGTITLNDVGDGLMKTFTMSQFAAFWTAYLNMAVVLE